MFNECSHYLISDSFKRMQQHQHGHTSYELFKLFTTKYHSANTHPWHLRLHIPMKNTMLNLKSLDVLTMTSPTQSTSNREPYIHQHQNGVD